jgi:membrane-associated protease RseP (regulator of RpoE activity)
VAVQVKLVGKTLAEVTHVGTLLKDGQQIRTVTWAAFPGSRTRTNALIAVLSVLVACTMPALWWMAVAMFVVHEGGHYMAARYYKLHVTDYAICAGPSILACNVVTLTNKGVKQTTYTLGTLPLYGYVRHEEGATPRQHIVIALAGPLMNILLGVACYTLMADWTTVGDLPHNLLAALPGVDMVSRPMYPLELFGHLNLLVAALNLLPIPPLDGGHVAYHTIRMTRWKETAERLYPRIAMVTVIALIILMFVGNC